MLDAGSIALGISGTGTTAFDEAGEDSEEESFAGSRGSAGTDGVADVDCGSGDCGTIAMASPLRLGVFNLAWTVPGLSGTPASDACAPD